MENELSLDWSILRNLKLKKSIPFHPYFTSQSTNIIENYIDFFTKEGDIILDPFCGSGTTGIAASCKNRKPILRDISPMAIFISKNTFNKINIKTTKNIFLHIKNEIADEINKSYEKEFIKQIGSYPEISLPKSSDAKDIKELFTDRNLYNLKILLDKINVVEDKPTRNFLLFIFSGILARASKTFFYDKAKWGGGNSSIFTKYRYWIPKNPDERNVWELFEIRFNRLISQKEELDLKLKENISCEIGSATHLSDIDDESIDYIYTDPPYGSNISYIDLSLLWIAWLGLEKNVDRMNEAIEGGSLSNSRDRYLELMEESFKEIYRVLKKDKYFSLVFQHKDVELWYDIVEKCQEQGFNYVNTIFYNSYYNTFHKNKNPKNVLSGQLIVNFKKNGNRKYERPIANSNSVNKIIEDIMFELEKNGESTTENVMNLLVPKLIESSIKPKNFDFMRYLKDNYYFSNDKKWKLKEKINVKDSTKKYKSIIVDFASPYDMSYEEAKTKLTELFNIAVKNLDENGSLWLISTDVRNGLTFVPISIISIDIANSFDFINHESIIWINEDNVGDGIFWNNYSNIQFFAKGNNYYFNKDVVREKHIWKDIEWGKRKFRYNEKGKDPGNVWIKNFDNGKGKIIKQDYYTKNEILNRLFSIAAEKDDSKLLITNDKIDSDRYDVIKYASRSETKQKSLSLNPPSKSKGKKVSAKIIFKSSENMSEVEDNFIKLIITSPPYWNLKNYKMSEQIGYDEDYETFLRRINSVLKECYRVLDVDGSLWINVNTRIVENVVYNLQKDIYDLLSKIGFKLIDIVIWHKSSGIPTSKKRLKDNFEYVLIFAKNISTFRYDTSKIYFDYKNNSKHERCPNIWNLNRFTGSIGKNFEHPAIYPDELVERAIELCTTKNQTVLDPFLGSGTTIRASLYLHRNSIGYEINKKFKSLINNRLRDKTGVDFFSYDIEYLE